MESKNLIIILEFGRFIPIFALEAGPENAMRIGLYIAGAICLRR